jgi:SAM-dependent methyltransferase
MTETTKIENKKHSQEHLFVEWRDYWWNQDFITLMAQRLDLAKVNAVLDVGCGVGHWGRVLYPHLNIPGATIAGIDREIAWVEKAGNIFREKFPQVPTSLISYSQAEATDLPFAANSFDMVTCQTLLMHLENPQKAIAEMIRVCRPGGLILCVEPENLFGCLGMSNLFHEMPVEDLSKIFEYELRLERGKRALGEGNNSIGGMVPGFFANLGLVNIQTYLCDKPSPLYAPYDDPEQKAIMEMMVGWEKEANGPLDRENCIRWFLAGGGQEDTFEEHWGLLSEVRKARHQALLDKTYVSGGGGVFYLIAGRKPGSKS